MIFEVKKRHFNLCYICQNSFVVVKISSNISTCISIVFFSSDIMDDQHNLVKVGASSCWSCIIWWCFGADILAHSERRHSESSNHLCRSCVHFTSSSGSWICGKGHISV